MSKRELIQVLKRKRHYKVCVEDIRKVYKYDIKKRPPVPSYEQETEDEVCHKELEKIVVS